MGKKKSQKKTSKANKMKDKQTDNLTSTLSVIAENQKTFLNLILNVLTEGDEAHVKDICRIIKEKQLENEIFEDTLNNITFKGTVITHAILSVATFKNIKVLLNEFSPNSRFTTIRN